jgi:hypothetical protein
VDDSDVVAESSEANNWGPIMKFVVDDIARPDLMAAFENPEEISAAPNEYVAVTLAVMNVGSEIASPQGAGDFDSVLYFAAEPNAVWRQLDGTNILGVVSMESLGTPEKEMQTVTFLSPGEEGIYYLRFGADIWGDVGENNEYNNWSARVKFVVAEALPEVSSGDFDSDGEVDMSDFAVLAAAWMSSEGNDQFNALCDIGLPADGVIDANDLGVLLDGWLSGKEPPPLVKGDFKLDGVVNFTDFAIFAAAWMTASGDDNYNAACDISDTEDDVIDLADLGVLADYWLAGKLSASNLKGDFQSDRIVNLADFAILAAAWMSEPGDDNYNAVCDIGEPADDVIDLSDLGVLADYWLTAERSRTGLTGDFNDDGFVNSMDFAILAAAWGAEPGDFRYNGDCDISLFVDNVIDLGDLIVFIEHWRESSWR